MPIEIIIMLSVLSLLLMGGLIVGLVDVVKFSKSKHRPAGPYEAFFKRVIDFECGMLVLVVLWPLYFILAIMVRVKLGSPILFKQDRPGKNEKIFKLCKFRTMTDERDENGELLPDEKRLTGFGSWLRRTSMDEIPEALNIIKGDMSLIGPRPLLVRYLPAYTEKEKHRHDVRPGLTGLAQVNGRNLVKWDQRLAYDVSYVERITFLGDAKIILKTIAKVLKSEDIAVNTDEVESYLDIERNAMKK